MKILSIALLLSTAAANAESELMPAELVARVKALGAKVVVHEIWQSESKTQVFLSGVGTGSNEWLRVARAIQPDTDAASAEELNYALAEALVNNPYAVLPWLQELWWNDKQLVCLFAYDSELPGGVSAYIVRLENALKNHPPVGSKSIRLQCLRGIKNTKSALATTQQE
ncbi:hypothetical protein ABT364_18685 [Massilia sp. SR12]